MAKFSTELLNMLCEFMVDEIEELAMYGITYAFVIKDEEGSDEKFKKYMNIRYEATQCGFTSDQVFTVKALGNGWIFDIELKTAKQILTELSKTIMKDDKEKIEAASIISNSPDERRRKDATALVEYIKREAESGKDSVKVAIYNRNSTPYITITAYVNGVKNRVRLNAYALKAEDLNGIFNDKLAKYGIHVKRIVVSDILPNRNGVLCTLNIEK